MCDHIACSLLLSLVIIDKYCYYIDRCEFSVFSSGNIFTQLQVWWLRPLLRYGEYIYDGKLKKFREMSLTPLAHNQHDVIDVI